MGPSPLCPASNLSVPVSMWDMSFRGYVLLVLRLLLPLCVYEQACLREERSCGGGLGGRLVSVGAVLVG